MDKRPNPMILTVDYTTGLFVPTGTLSTSDKYEPLLEFVSDGAKKVDVVNWLVKRGYSQDGGYKHIKAAVELDLLTVSPNGRMLTPVQCQQDE